MSTSVDILLSTEDVDVGFVDKPGSGGGIPCLPKSITFCWNGTEKFHMYFRKDFTRGWNAIL